MSDEKNTILKYFNHYSESYQRELADITFIHCILLCFNSFSVQYLKTSL